MTSEYQIRLPSGDLTLSTPQFLIYLSDEAQVDFSYSIKSKYVYIAEYFATHIYSRETFRMMIYELREGLTSKGKPLAKATCNKYIMVAKYIDKFLNTNIIQDYQGFKKLGAIKPHGELLTDSEMKRISESYLHRTRLKRTTNWKINNVMRFVYTTMRFTGMTPDEMVNLTWNSDCETHFNVYRQKTGKEHIVPIVPDMRRVMDKLEHYPHGYIVALSEKGPITTKMIRDDLRARVLSLGIKKKICPYSFRYSMITECYANAGDGVVPKIAEISGHSITTAMKHYNKQNAKVVIDALYSTHPGLINKQKIDSIKRLVVQMLTPMIDMSKYTIEIEILPKQANRRVIKLS